MNKHLVIAGLALIFVVVFCFIIIVTDVGVALFNLALGNQIYALTIRYDTIPNRYSGELIGFSFTFKFTLEASKVAVETLIYQQRGYFQIQNLSNILLDSFVLSLPVTVHVLNRRTVFAHTFTFNDANSREITIYLNLRQNYQEVNVEIDGFYQMDGSEVEVNVGDQLPIH